MNERSYSKLFSSIVTSSLWSETSDIRIVWLTMMALKNQYGEVMASIPGLARAANVPLQVTEEALEKFKSPDKYSRTKDHDGRRIEEIPGGWRLLNHDYYRTLMSQDERREYRAQKQRERRERKRSENQSEPKSEAKVKPNEADCNTFWSDTDTDTDTDINKEEGNLLKEPKTTSLDKVFPIRKRLNTLFKRRDATEWSDKEVKSLHSLMKRKEFEVELSEIEKLYNSGFLYRRKEIQTLFNNWTGEVDKARNKQADMPQVKNGYHKIDTKKMWTAKDRELAELKLESQNGIQNGR